MSALINIKNQGFSLPVIEVLGFDIKEIISELSRRVSVDSESIQAIPCVLSISSTNLQPTFLAQLVEALRQVNLQAVGLQTEDELLAEQAAYASLAVFNERLNQYDLFHAQPKPETVAEADSMSSQFIHQGHVESGEQVYAESQDLVILGDVKAGAEVIADGSIYVGGSLQGKAYAGNSGLMNIDETYIRAYAFEPELISISGFYQLDEDIPSHYYGLAVKVNFANQKMNFELE